MKKRIVSAVALILILCFSLASCMSPSVPSIGDNGNWFIDGTDTGVSAVGPEGDKGPDGDKGDVGETGEAGAKGESSGVESIKLLSETDEQSFYEIVYTNGQKASFSVSKGADGKSSGEYAMSENQIKSNVLGDKILTKTARSLSSGEYLNLAKNTLMNSKTLSFYCNLNSIPEGACIKVGHGETSYGGTYLQIEKTKIKHVEYATGASIREYEHKLDIKGFLAVNVEVGFGHADVTVMTLGGMYKSRPSWGGRQGAIFASPSGMSIDNVSMSWSADSLSENIWLFGDSYFNCIHATRWPSYLFKSGLESYAMFAFPGMGTATALEDFKWAVLELGYAPQYVVWCMGMNNGDKDDVTVNASWLELTTEFLSICEEKGITPILTTIPSTPIIYNRAKSQWVIDSGYRYVDFEAAVGAKERDVSLIGEYEATKSDGTKMYNKTGYRWTPGMIDVDCVHPATNGAAALYMRFLTEFPEITYRR